MQRSNAIKPRWDLRAAFFWPLILWIVLTSLALVLTFAIRVRETHESEIAAKITADQVSRRLESYVTARLNTLWQLVDVVPPKVGGSDTAFVSYASMIIEHLGGFQALNWIDSDLIIRSIVPQEGNQQALNRHLLEHPHPSVPITIEHALKTKRLAVTPPVELLQGGLGIASYLPVYSNEGRFLGMINGVFRITEMVEETLAEPELFNQYELAILDSDRTILYKSVGDLVPDTSEIVIEQPMKLFSHRWVLFLRPRLEATASNKRIITSIFMLFGLVFSTAIAVFFRILYIRRLKLAESESRFRALFEDSLDAICVMEKEGDFIDANKAFLDLFGMEREELGNHNIRDLYYDVTDNESFRNQLMQTGYLQENQLRVRAKNGEMRTCLVTATLIENAYQGEDIIQGIIHDITDRLELEERFHQSQKMEALGRLAGGVAHDFNNLLTAILGQAEISSQNIPSNSPAQRNIQDIKETADRAAELTRRLLAFSRKQSFRPRPIDISATIRGMEKLFVRLVGEDVELRLELERDELMIDADPMQIEQVLINLVVNSRDAMPEGGFLKIRTERVAEEGSGENGSITGERARMTVHDTGSGITEEVVPHIFEPYFTTKQELKGTGLGLSTVFGIIDQLNGTIEVQTDHETFTTMVIEFPVSAQKNTQIVPTQKEDKVVGGVGTILVVEDDRAVRETTKALLTHLGYDVVIAASPEEGIEEMQKLDGNILLLLSDVVMPGMSGPAMAERIRRQYPDIKVLFMSGHTAQEFHRRGLLEPDDQLLQKPFTLKDLSQKIREVIDA